MSKKNRKESLMTDEELIGLYYSRDEAAIAQTRTHYGRLMRSVAYGILRNAEDAEECENDAYLRAWNSIPPARPKSMCGYMARLARCAALDRYSYNNAAKRGEALPLDELEGCIRDVSSAEDRFTERELTQLLNRFLKAQDYNTRVIFMRRYWLSENIGEIAKTLHVSQSMVKSRISRTLKKLREFLRAEGYDL